MPRKKWEQPFSCSVKLFCSRSLLESNFLLLPNKSYISTYLSHCTMDIYISIVNLRRCNNPMIINFDQTGVNIIPSSELEIMIGDCIVVDPSKMTF